MIEIKTIVKLLCRCGKPEKFMISIEKGAVRHERADQ